MGVYGFLDVHSVSFALVRIESLFVPTFGTPFIFVFTYKFSVVSSVSEFLGLGQKRKSNKFSFDFVERSYLFFREQIDNFFFLSDNLMGVLASSLPYRSLLMMLGL